MMFQRFWWFSILAAGQNHLRSFKKITVPGPQINQSAQPAGRGEGVYTETALWAQALVALRSIL